MAKIQLLRKYNHKKLDWLHDSLFFIIMVILVFIIFRFVIGVSIVSGDSMEPNLHNGEWVVYLRTVKNYEPGDVVSIWVPSGDYYVKRVVAVGGSQVELAEGKVYVDGELYEDVYANGATLPEEGTVIYPYTVRDKNVFVLGDNREVSLDSRGFGEVNKVQIRGKIIWRLGRWYAKAVD